MKRTLSLFYGLLSVVLLFGNNQSLLEQGNTAFKESNFQEAESFYKQILENGDYSLALYYNLGNTHFKLNNSGLSRLYYEKALKLNGGDEEIINNLNLLKSRLKDEIEPVPAFFLLEVWRSSRSLLVSSSWFVLSMLFLWAGIAALVFNLFGSLELNRMKKVLVFIAFLFSLIFLIYSYSQFQFQKNVQEAVILAESASLYEGADERAPTIRVLHEGTKVGILDGLQNWTKVVLEDGDIGWMKQEVLESI